MLNSDEHEILNSHKYEKNQEIGHFSGSDNPRMQFYLLINAQQLFFFITSGPEPTHFLTYLSVKQTVEQLVMYRGLSANHILLKAETKYETVKTNLKDPFTEKVITQQKK